MSIQFYEEIPGFAVSSSNITISQCSFTLETTMKNLYLQFVTRKILGYKPTHHIFTKTLGVTVPFSVKR
jgi:hypothetical protein